MVPATASRARESSIVKSITALAKSRGYWVLKIAGGMYQRPGLPDLMLIKGGRAVFLEAKRPGCRPTPRQLAVMAEISRHAGAPCYVVTSRREAEQILRNLEAPENKPWAS